jgi:hypothetical protein
MKLLRTLFHQLEKTMAKLPHLPHQGMAFALSLLPGICIALAILHSMMGFVALVTSNYWFDQPFAPIPPVYLMIIGMLSLANSLLLLISYNDLAEMTRRGWKNLVLIVCVSLLAALFGVIFFPFKFVGFVMSVILSIYVLFEAKPYFRH